VEAFEENSPGRLLTYDGIRRFVLRIEGAF